MRSRCEVIVAMIVHCDNQNFMKLTLNFVFHTQTKHIGTLQITSFVNFTHHASIFSGIHKKVKTYLKMFFPTKG
jgi:hypothetical protein